MNTYMHCILLQGGVIVSLFYELMYVVICFITADKLLSSEGQINIEEEWRALKVITFSLQDIAKSYCPC